MAIIARACRFDRGRAAAAAGAFRCLAHGFGHREEIRSVDGARGHPERSGARSNILCAAMIGNARAFAIAVVLQNKDGRQFENDREVHRFEHRALIGTAIAGEGNGQFASF